MISKQYNTLASILLAALSLFFYSNTHAITCPLITTGGDHASAFEVSDSSQRLFLYQLPINYDHNRVTPYPVIFNFHGGGQSAYSYSNRPGQLALRAIADSVGEESIIVYPHGSETEVEVVDDCNAIDKSFFQPAAWNSDYCCTEANDELFAEELITHIETGLNTDSTRMYALGYSNGGIFTHRVASLFSHKIAAFASVSSTAGGQKNFPLVIDLGDFPILQDLESLGDPDVITLFFRWSNVITPPYPENMVPMMMVNNINDMTMPFYGGTTGNADVRHMSNESSWNYWYTANACNTPYVYITQHDNSITTYENQSHTCQSDLPISMRRVILDDILPAGQDNKDHYWPIASDGFDTSREIVDFLMQFTR